jgi:hypothetical protein
MYNRIPAATLLAQGCAGAVLVVGVMRMCAKTLVVLLRLSHEATTFLPLVSRRRISKVLPKFIFTISLFMKSPVP